MIFSRVVKIFEGIFEALLFGGSGQICLKNFCIQCNVFCIKKLHTSLKRSISEDIQFQSKELKQARCDRQGNRYRINLLTQREGKSYPVPAPLSTNK